MEKLTIGREGDADVVVGEGLTGGGAVGEGEESEAVVRGAVGETRGRERGRWVGGDGERFEREKKN